jgi:hypothetical protein
LDPLCQIAYKVRILAATGTETDVQEDNKNNLINTKDSQIPVHQIGTMQQKSVNFLWIAQTKLTCKNYFSNNLQYEYFLQKKKREFL